MSMASLTGDDGWLQANPEVFEQAARALIATSGAIQQVVNRRDAAIQALTSDPSAWHGRASMQFAHAWARRREELLRQMVTQQEASIVYQRFAAALADAQKAWQRLTEQAALAAQAALIDEVLAVQRQADEITTQVLDADRRAAAQLSELARRDPRPVVEDTTNLPVLLQAGMRGQIADAPLPVGTDPNVVAAWFAALSPQVRDRLVRTAPNLMGNLNGLPPDTRDQANRLAIAVALATAGADGASDTRVETYKRLLALDAGHTILAFSPEHNGRVAIAVGDITTASNVGVILPGMDTTIDKYDGYLGSANELMLTIEEQFNPGGEPDTAMVAWLNYDAPQGLLSTLNPFNGYPNAQAGAPRIAEFTEGLNVTHQGDPHLSVVAHSYGLCLNRFGGAADANSLIYVRQVRDFDFDSAHGDQMIDEAERYWREQGLEIHRDDGTPGVTRISSGTDGFGYSLVVNRNGPLISMRGKTPCFPSSELTEAGLG